MAYLFSFVVVVSRVCTVAGNLFLLLTLHDWCSKEVDRYRAHVICIKCKETAIHAARLYVELDEVSCNHNELVKQTSKAPKKYLRVRARL